MHVITSLFGEVFSGHMKPKLLCIVEKRREAFNPKNTIPTVKHEVNYLEIPKQHLKTSVRKLILVPTESSSRAIILRLHLKLWFLEDDIEEILEWPLQRSDLNLIKKNVMPHLLGGRNKKWYFFMICVLLFTLLFFPNMGKLANS